MSDEVIGSSGPLHTTPVGRSFEKGSEVRTKAEGDVAYRRAHAFPDTDDETSSIHHTLGWGTTQAAPGGATNKRLEALEGGGGGGSKGLWLAKASGTGNYQAISPNTDTIIVYQTVKKNDGTATYNLGTGIVTIAEEGWYHIFAHYRGEGAYASQRTTLWIGDPDASGFSVMRGPSWTNVGQERFLSGVTFLSAGQKIAFYMNHAQSGNINAVGDSSGSYTCLVVVKL